jgi:hypothetical protein
MIALLYTECVLVALLTIGFVKLASIAVTVGPLSNVYTLALLVAGGYGLFSLWWLLVLAIKSVQTNKRHVVPIPIGVGIVVGACYGFGLIVDVWFGEGSGFVERQFPAGLFLLVGLLTGVAVHVWSVVVKSPWR